MTESGGEPLFRLLRQIRRPVTLREIVARCLRHVYMGDPFGSEEGCVPPPPPHLFDQVVVREVDVTGIRCVIYSPKECSKQSALLLYMHGGGFVVASSEDSDYITRMLCHSNSVVVVSINYAMAPESMFPGAIDDCMKAMDWAIANSCELGIDPENIFIAGDSAGGNLAAAMGLKLQERGTPAQGLVLLAPWLDMNLEQYDSYNRLAPDGIVYDAAFMGYARAAYVRFEDWANPLASPTFSDPSKWPPTIILVGDDDPLVDQSTGFKDRANVAGCNQIELILYPGMPHCFYSFANLFDEEQDCYQRIAAFLSHLVEVC